MITIVMPTGRLLGGAERALLAALESAGFRALVDQVVFLEDGDLVTAVRHRGVPVQVVPLKRVKDPVGLARCTFRVAGLLRRAGSTHVVSWMTKASFVSGPASRIAGRRGRPVHVLYQHGPAVQNGFDKWAARMPTDHVLACSAWVAETCIQVWTACPVDVVHPPLMASAFRPEPPPSQVTRRRQDNPGVWVVLVSRWQEWKGVHLAVEAVGMPAWPEGVRLVLVGGPVPTEPDYADRIAWLIRASPQRANIVQVGQQPDGAAWMRAADLVLHLSQDEPYGLVLLEAAAVGRPVLSCGGGGADEILSSIPSGYRTTRDAAAIARQVSALLGTRDRLGPAVCTRPGISEDEFGPPAFLARITQVLGTTGWRAGAS